MMVLKKNTEVQNGIEELIKKYRASFHIPENINYYSEKDYKIAERKYIKDAVIKGEIIIPDNKERESK